jgi:hypothetical protein
VRSPEATEEEVAAAKFETDDAPMCGSCLLLVSRVRRIAAAHLKRHPTVWPERPSEAWANLRGTRWAYTFDLDGHAKKAEYVDKYSRFEAFMDAVDPVSVDELLAEWEGKDD